MGPMGELGVLFNPGMRHEQEEKLAKQMLREDEGTGRKGRRGIDLESGVVVIGADDAPPAEPPDRDAHAAQSPADIPGRGHDDATDRDDDDSDRDVAHRRASVTGRDQARASSSRRRGGGAASSAPASAQPVGKARRSR